MIGRRVIADWTYHQVSRELLAARMRARLTQKQVASRMETTVGAIVRPAIT